MMRLIAARVRVTSRPVSSSRVARRSVGPSSTTPITITSRNGACSRKEYEVCEKSICTSAAPSAPTASAGRNGLMPTAAAMPIPWKMSKTRCTVLYRDRGDDRRDGSVSPGGLERDPDPVHSGREGRDLDLTAPRRRSSARDIQRYAALFAQRTKVMRSSAMRDLMALTEREDVISLAGGLPDTSTFPADSYAALMSTVAADSCARALQYGPTEGFARVKDCIAQVMAAEGMEVDTDELLVTSGGQQVIDLVCKTLVDPGRCRRRRGAHLPRRDPHLLLLPGRRRAGGDGSRRHAHR